MGSRRWARYARSALVSVAVAFAALACGDDGRDPGPRPRIPRTRRVPPGDGPVRGAPRDGAGLATRDGQQPQLGHVLVDLASIRGQGRVRAGRAEQDRAVAQERAPALALARAREAARGRSRSARR